MSWYEISKKVRVLTEGTSGTSAGIKKIAASKKRLFRVAIMSCACLLMNTAATVSLSVVLEDWSVSSDQWLTCTVVETFNTWHKLEMNNLFQICHPNILGTQLFANEIKNSITNWLIKHQ